jgi:hypothetical protein
MEPLHESQDDLFYELGLALLELLDRPIDLELEQTGAPDGLVLTGTLLRAFDTPAQASLSITIGAHTISIRPTPIKQLQIKRNNLNRHQIQSIHLLLTDGFSLHIKPP